MMERRITMALLFAMALEAAGVFLWTGAAAQRLSSLEERLIDQAPIPERMARIETELVAMRRQLDRIEKRLEPARRATQ